MKAFYLALQFLTRLPVPSEVDTPDEALQGRSVLFYPLVGAVIGLLLLLLHWLLEDTSTLLQAALLLGVWIAITGALHLDGLADLADGWVGGQGDRERTLEIMKDSQAGPMAIVALVVVLLIKLAALEVILSAGWGVILLLVPLFGRASLIAALLYMPYVRPEGLGAAQAAALPRERAEVVLVVVALVALLLLGWHAFLLIGATAAAFALMRQQLLSRLEGVTGDAAGAICEVAEMVALVAMALTV